MQSNMFSPLRTLFRLDEKYLECSFIYFNVEKDYLLEKKNKIIPVQMWSYLCRSLLIMVLHPRKNKKCKLRYQRLNKQSFYI